MFTLRAVVGLSRRGFPRHSSVRCAVSVVSWQGCFRSVQHESIASPLRRFPVSTAHFHPVPVSASRGGWLLASASGVTFPSDAVRRLQSSSATRFTEDNIDPDVQSPNLYRRLGFPEGTDPSSITADDIKRYFRIMAKRYHPDTMAAAPTKEKEAAATAFRNLQEAYETLSDAGKRQTYDMTGQTASQNVADGTSHGNYQDPFGGAFSFSGTGMSGRYNVRYNMRDGKGKVQMPVVLVALAGATFLACCYIIIGRLLLSGDAVVVADTTGERISARRLLRPFLGMLILVSLLPRFPAAFLCWYMWVYRPAIQRGEALSAGPAGIEGRWRRGSVVMQNNPAANALVFELIPARPLDNTGAALPPDALAVQDEAHAIAAGLTVAVALRKTDNPSGLSVEFASPVLGSRRVVLPPQAASEFCRGPAEAVVRVRRADATVVQEQILTW